MTGEKLGEPEVVDRVSVVIPYFNASATLGRALASVFAQTAPVLEVIVVDDASARWERERASSIAAQHERVRVISSKENGGPATARNIGWDEARGDWIAFLDSDDAWHPRKIEIQIRCARAASPSPTLVACGARQVATLEELSLLPIPDAIATAWVRKRHLLMRNRIATSSVVLRKDMVGRFSSGRRFAEDYELWLTIAGRGDALLRVEASLAGSFKARYGESGLSSNTWRMVVGEYRAYLGASRAGALTSIEVIAALAVSTVRSCVRLVRIAARRFGLRA